MPRSGRSGERRSHDNTKRVVVGLLILTLACLS